jgi:putative Ig domain-containing protein
MRVFSAAALFLAMAGFGAAQIYTFDVIGTYTGLSNPNGDATTPFVNPNRFELKFSTGNTFTPTLSGPNFTALTNITYANNGVTQTAQQGSMVLCTPACNSIESGGFDVTLNSIYGPGDFLEFQLSGAQLFSGTVVTPTILTGIFPLSGGGVSGVGVRYQDPVKPCCATETVANVLVVITVQAANAPVINSLTPPGVTAGSDGFPLTVTGSGFQAGALVYWNGSPLATAFNDATRLIATVTADLIASPGTATVTVANPGSLFSNTAPFLIGRSFTGLLTILTSPVLPPGHPGVFYSQRVIAISGSPPYSFSLVAGGLPASLSLSSTGVISGTPLVNTTATFTVAVTDSVSASATQAFTLTISPITFDFTSALRVAQIVEGLNWKTSFIITNLDQTPADYVFRFWDDSGNPLPLPIVNRSPGTLTGTLAVGGTTFAETPGNSATLLQGWAEVATTGRVGVTTIFRSVVPGKPDFEATVTGVSSGSRITLPFDNTQGFLAGVAVANTNPSQPLTITLTFQLDNGAQISGSLFLPAHAHTAFDLATRFPVVAGERGSILFTASSPDIAVVGLSFSPGGSFASLESFQ